LNAENLIEVDHVTFGYDASRSILSDVSLQFPRGKITSILGGSGCGKTTLLRLIGGSNAPNSGEVRFDGERLVASDRAQIYRLRRRLGMLFQFGALFTDLSVFDNVAFPLREHTDLPEALIRDVVLMKLNAVGLRGARDLMPSQLSGGMARRVALARTIALDPKFIMYDEPFTGQDPIAMGVLVSLIRGLNESLAMTSLVVSHDIHETASIADQIYIISDGRVIGEGTPDQLRDHPSTMVRQFMLGSPDGPVPFHYPADNFIDDVLGDA
jgi:phospholipid/cholesterol/gamma-HCH transport system ATP-binding protein